jgi:hypothetical protein
MISINVKESLKSFKTYLKEKLNKNFSYYQMDEFIYGFEGAHIYVDEYQYFYRFIVDLKNDKYGIYFIKSGDFSNEIIDNTTIDESIRFFNFHYNDFMAMNFSYGKTAVLVNLR